MVSFLCSFWPLLLAGLIGWLLSGLLARHFLRGNDMSAALGAKTTEVNRLSQELTTLRARPPIEKIVEKPVDRIVEKIVEKPVDRVVEKLVDNPLTLSRMATLTAEVAVIAGLRSRIKELESTPPTVVEKVIEKPVDRVVERIVEKPVDRIVEKIIDRPVDRIVEKIVDRPVDRIIEKIVEKPVDRIVEKIVEKPVDRIVEKIVDRPVDRVVEKVVEKLVDNPATMARVAALTAEVAVIAGLRSRVQQLEATPPKVVEKIVEKIVDRPVDRIVEKLVPDTRGLEERDRQIADWRARHGDVERRLQAQAALVAERDGELHRMKQDPAIDAAAARQAGVTVKGADDIEIVEGIGPKIADLLRASGIKTFAELARTPTSKIQSILDAGGPQFRIANPGTWAEQADLAARNRWVTFKSLTDVLVAGVRVDVEANKAQAKQAQDKATGDLSRRLSDLEAQLAAQDSELKRLKAGDPIDLKAARAAGFTIKGVDDLEIIEGIGPKIAELLNAAGVRRFAELATMTPAQIQPILDAAGPNFKLADPGTWPEQADLAARNRWLALKALQDVLDAGKRA